MNYSDYKKLIDSWIVSNKDRIIENWTELIKIPSITSEALPGAPFGEKCRDALHKAASFFAESEDISCKICDDAGYALASYGDGEKTIGLFAHSDVVPVGEGWIYTEPFVPVIKDGALIGRGAEDNKSGIMAALCLMEFLRDNNINLGSKVTAFIGSDEECGMKDLDGYVAQEKMPDISIVPDADFPCSVGEKGIYHFWLKSKEPFEEILDVRGGDAFNIVLDNAEFDIVYSDSLYSELTELCKNDERLTVSRSGDVIRFTAKGISKHASIPEDSLNAAFLGAETLYNTGLLAENDSKIIYNAILALANYYGNGIGIDHKDENFGRTTAVNGMVKLSDGHLMLSFDVRYGDSLSAHDLEAEIDKAADELGFIVEGKVNSPGFSIDKNSKIPNILEDVYFDVTGERAERVLMSGGTYARKLKNAFSVGTFYTSPDRKDAVLKMPDGHGGPHQRDEMIDIESFFHAVKILICYVIACDDYLNS